MAIIEEVSDDETAPDSALDLSSHTTNNMAAARGTGSSHQHTTNNMASRGIGSSQQRTTSMAARGMGSFQTHAPTSNGAPSLPAMMMMMSMPQGGEESVWDTAERQVAESRSRKACAVPEWDSGIAELMSPIGAHRICIGVSSAHADRAMLKEHGIVAVLTVGANPPPCKAGVARKHSIKLGDLSSAPVLAHLPKAFDFIDAAQKEGAVLVTSEDEDATEAAATTVVVGWLMARQQVPWGEAPGIVKADRPTALLNKNFEKQLRVWSRWEEFPGLPDWVVDGF